MMSSKRKQEEKHLQILKKNLQIECNKRCAECDQRGPTYVDVTIGSFVCTSCGGILRGLNPAHRVKSVSMATFTSSEIALVEMRGNDYCKKVYLGKYDPRSKAKPEAKHPAKLKHFMELKYEQKRWYVSPEQVNKPLDSFIKSATNGARRDRNMLESSKKVVPVSMPSSKPSMKGNGFASDVNTFAPINTTLNSNKNTPAGEGFADFNSAFATQSSDAFGYFTPEKQNNDPSIATADKTSDFSNILAPMSAINMNQQPFSTTSKPVDKYADLVDLFTAENTSSPTTVWSGLSTANNNFSGGNAISKFGIPNVQQAASSLNSINQLQDSTVGSTQSSSSMFSNLQQQQSNIFGQPATTRFGTVTQPNMMNMQSQAISVFGNPKQQPLTFGSEPQSTSVYGNPQLIAGSISQFNSAAMFDTTIQNSNNSLPSQTFSGATSTPASNPFVQSTVTSSTQPPNGTNPFMTPQQQSQNPFSTQSSGTNPFMQNPPHSQNQISTNPFF